MGGSWWWCACHGLGWWDQWCAQEGRIFAILRLFCPCMIRNTTWCWGDPFVGDLAGGGSIAGSMTGYSRKNKNRRSLFSSRLGYQSLLPFSSPFWFSSSCHLIRHIHVPSDLVWLVVWMAPMRSCSQAGSICFDLVPPIVCQRDDLSFPLFKYFIIEINTACIFAPLQAWFPLLEKKFSP